MNGKIRMSQVTLRPHITLDVGANETRARQLVDKAHDNCWPAAWMCAFSSGDWTNVLRCSSFVTDAA